MVNIGRTALSLRGHPPTELVGQQFIGVPDIGRHKSFVKPMPELFDTQSHTVIFGESRSVLIHIIAEHAADAVDPTAGRSKSRYPVDPETILKTRGRESTVMLFGKSVQRRR